MEKKDAFQRLVMPAGIVLGVMILSSLAYDWSRDIENRTIHLVVAYISALLLFLSIWMGALFSNPMAFSRGATFRERLVVNLVTPVVYSSKVLYSLYGIYTWGEFLYFFLHSMVLGAPVVALFCMGLSELWCRGRYNRRQPGDKMPLLEFSNVAVLVAGLFFILLFLWNGGLYYIYNVYMELYRVLFV